MKLKPLARFFTLIAICLSALLTKQSTAQTFVRSELAPDLKSPWEITYGPDGYLWLTEAGGTVSRVHPESGAYELIYQAPDYFAGSEGERLNACHNPWIGHGTLGLALHPDFLEPESSFIYFVYSYNDGSESEPKTKFKIRRIRWDAGSKSISESLDIVKSIPTSYDHLGGRLISVKETNISYLYLSIGDHGISEDNSPDCYTDQRLNPNAFAQDVSTWNGKIHRFNMDGSIPESNPISGNSMYTRGHRNPQGLMYNSLNKLLYDVEHGDRTDDEINVLYKGANYGWKAARGYHDGNHPGEMDFVNSYASSANIGGDALIPAFYSWCDVALDTSSDNSNWCTVAPSDGIFYCGSGIPGWHNSLLVVTLKNGSDTDMEVYRFQLEADGSLAASTTDSPNPSKHFGEDQELNGRLRDITYSPDGRKLFLINNGGSERSKITIYEASSTQTEKTECGVLFPNPANDELNLSGWNNDEANLETYALSSNGSIHSLTWKNDCTIDLSTLNNGVYTLVIESERTSCRTGFVKTAD